MNLFDPARAKLANGRPMYYNPFGTAVAAIPHVVVEHNTMYNVTASVMLAVGPNRYSQHHWSGLSSDLPKVLNDMAASPEDCFRQHFKWKWQGGTDPEEITLESLGF